MTVFVNETAHFSCEVSSGCARWRFDGHFFYELPLDVRKDIEISCISPMSYLDILARPSYDGMTVQCVIADIGGGIKAKSENATLHVLTGVYYIYGRKVDIQYAILPGFQFSVTM